MSAIDNSRNTKIFGAAWAAAIVMGAALDAAAQAYPVNLLETARTAPQEWAYTFTQPGDDWTSAGYDDGVWNRGMSGFGTKGTPGAVVFTEWNGTDIWLRKVVNIKDLSAKSGITAVLHYDENTEVYVNGKKIIGTEGYSIRYETMFLDVEMTSAFQEGDNLIAVHCKQTVGGQYVDFGLVEYLGGFADDLIKPSFNQSQDWKYATDDPNADWTAPDYDDASWQSGKGAFGNGGDFGTQILTPWTTDDIRARTVFEVKNAAAIDHLILTLAHDDEVTVYLNGVQVADLTGYSTQSFPLDITGPGKKALKDGSNVLAVKGHNVPGTPQFVDVSLMSLSKEAPVALRPRPAAAAAPKFFSWRPGQSRLLIGAQGRLIDLSGRAAHQR